MERTLIMDRNKVFFIVGSQDLYGEETLRKVAENSQKIVEEMNKSDKLSADIVLQPTVRNPQEIITAIKNANNDDNCIGIITWMHTFSPAKMWINGLKLLQKPMLHFATQANEFLPWDTIDMDFMNLNQAAHGDREFGYICTRLGLKRKIVVGKYNDPNALASIENWIRAAYGWRESQTLKIARIGDNMREVAVTEGNKVSAQIKFGFSVNTYGVGDVVNFINSVSEDEIKNTVAEYEKLYLIPDRSEKAISSIYEAAKQEVGLRKFLKSVGAKGFTTTFEDLHGLQQLPGLACQRLMAEGYGFGAEGDWKTAAMLRIIKVMTGNNKTSFMEDYTYHLEPNRERVLGAHMLEVCPTIAESKPTLEVHELGIGGKSAPARLIFSTAPSKAINCSLLDMGDEFKLLANVLETVKADQKMPKLPVASAVWIPQPNFKEGVKKWIENGGAHHSVYSQALNIETLEDFCRMADIEMTLI